MASSSSSSKARPPRRRVSWLTTTTTTRSTSASSVFRLRSSPIMMMMMMMTTTTYLVVLLAAAGSVVVTADDGAAALKAHFYRRSCPAAEAVVRDIVVARVAADPAALPAKLLRLFFHDCFVRGCDASVLLDSPPPPAPAGLLVGKKKKNNKKKKQKTAVEKDAAPNRSLGGFDVIDTAKAVLEAVCPGVVSCADVLALAARDAVSFQFGRELWDVQLGRRDGVVSRASEALADLPKPSDNFTALEASFAKKGLDVKDLVILSGAHTIGAGHCNAFAARLGGIVVPNSNSNSTATTAAAAKKKKADPTLNAAYAAQLRTTCGPSPSANNSTAVPLDPGGSAARFDAHYYVNLKLGRGLFASDAALLTDRRAAGMIHRLTRHEGYFIEEFGKAVSKMGSVGVRAGEEGEIRRNCRRVNTWE